MRFTLTRLGCSLTSPKSCRGCQCGDRCRFLPARPAIVRHIKVEARSVVGDEADRKDAVSGSEKPWWPGCDLRHCSIRGKWQGLPMPGSPTIVRDIEEDIALERETAGDPPGHGIPKAQARLIAAEGQPTRRRSVGRSR